MDLSGERTSYEVDGIDLNNFESDPFAQFGHWFKEASDSGEPEPYAFVLATVDRDGWPSSRTVLLRGVDESGFVFYTNYESDKAKDLEAAKRAGMTFLWHGQHRQVHVSGTVERVGADESDAYFAKRPRDSQLGAWASEQSSVITGRSVLEERLAEATDRFDGRPVERPEFWGGYRILPRWVEFWQGQPSRLHDRVRFLGRSPGQWDRLILSP